MIAGARLLCSSASPREMLDLLEAERPTMTNGVASTMLALANVYGVSALLLAINIGHDGAHAALSRFKWVNQVAL